MTEEDAIQSKRLSAAQIQLAGQNPFFACLMLMSRNIFTDQVDTAATDGVSMYFNSKFMKELTMQQFKGVVIHEVLHAALLHIPRRGAREPLLWNIAADIQVNSLIRGQIAIERSLDLHVSLDLPNDLIEDESLAHLSVEEIYAVLQRDGYKGKKLLFQDLQPELGEKSGSKCGPASETNWGAVIHRAMAANLCAGRGTVGGALGRVFEETYNSQLDWRSALWKFVVQTPDDYGGFDRRHVWQGIYIETLEAESICVDVCVDTSGSIDKEMLSRFIGEVRGIACSYPTIRCRLFYADVECSGPFEIHADHPIPAPIGGGGTSFVPFFHALKERDELSTEESQRQNVAVYLTDGYGEFPESPPARSVLWVVSAGGVNSASFPFGQVSRMQQ